LTRRRCNGKHSIALKSRGTISKALFISTIIWAPRHLGTREMFHYATHINHYAACRSNHTRIGIRLRNWAVFVKRVNRPLKLVKIVRVPVQISQKIFSENILTMLEKSFL
jgi:hypothetical protein